MATDRYVLGDDIVLVESFVDGNGDPILLDSLEGYGVELSFQGNPIGQWGVGITDFTDQYITKSGDSQVTVYIPKDVFTETGTYYLRLKIVYQSFEFPDDNRELYSNKVTEFTIGAR